MSFWNAGKSFSRFVASMSSVNVGRRKKSACEAFLLVDRGEGPQYTIGQK